MIFSERKIREIANLDTSITLEQILNAINSIGFEVEEVKKFNNNKGLKFGRVLDVSKNPNSNKLNVCKIQFNDQERIIQTAAQNVKIDDYLIAFVPGSICNGIEIKSKELGKITSHGMLASLEELGFDKNLLRKEWREQILIIDKVDLNLDPIEYFELDDNLIDVSILTNRSDAQCYLILAKELSAYFNTVYKKDLNLVNSQFKPTIMINSNTNENNVNGFEIKKVQEFKLNLKDIILILKSNFKLNDDFSDFSLLTMIYTGVYPRIYDLDKITKKEINILKEKEITYLGNEKEKLSILGVEVLNDFKPNNKTSNLFIEISQIDTKVSRTNSRNSKIVNQSSINSSKKISIGSLNFCYQFIASFFENVSCLIKPLNNEKLKINFDIEYIIKYAGYDITKNDFYKKAISSLDKLDFKIDDKYIFIPSYRHDIWTMQDIVEEIFRFYGLNNFKPMQPSIKTTKLNEFIQYEKLISSLGYTQAWTYTLINKELNKQFNPFNFQEEFNLKTFVSEEYNCIRNSIALPLFNVFEYNFKRKINQISLFDIGMINNKKALIIASDFKTYKELKEDIEKITNQKFEIKKLNNEIFHPQYNALLYLGGQQVGWIGKFNPFWIDTNIIFAEVLLDVIYTPKTQFQEYENEPLKERDITISLNKDYSPITYIHEIQKIGEFFSIDLISTFEKDDKTNWTYKIKMSSSTCEKFDNKIDEILKKNINDFW